MIKLILIIGLGVTAYNYYQAPEAEYVSKNGFVSLPKPSNFNTDSVIIFAAQNCTKAAARRADSLAAELSSRNIPYTRASRASFSNYDPSLKKQLDSVMRGTLPIVFIDDMAKANPTLEEVLAEFDAIYE